MKVFIPLFLTAIASSLFTLQCDDIKVAKKSSSNSNKYITGNKKIEINTMMTVGILKLSVAKIMIKPKEQKSQSEESNLSQMNGPFVFDFVKKNVSPIPSLTAFMGGTYTHFRFNYIPSNDDEHSYLKDRSLFIGGYFLKGRTKVPFTLKVAKLNKMLAIKEEGILMTSSFPGELLDLFSFKSWLSELNLEEGEIDNNELTIDSMTNKEIFKKFISAAKSDPVFNHKEEGTNKSNNAN